jgi:hypothetical protein
VKRAGAFVYVFGLFLLGVLIGGLGMHLYYAVKHPGPPAGRSWGGQGFVRLLNDELELTDAQHDRILEIVGAGHARFDAMRAELGPRIREHVESMHAEIREELTVEQQPAFDTLLERHQRHAERFFMGGGRHGLRHKRPGPPPGGGEPPGGHGE